jgi:elongation factor 2
MDYKHNIRNMSVIAHVDHGKSTLTDSLVCKAGIISARNAGTARYTDTRADEQERGITIKSTGISMYFEYDMSAGEVLSKADVSTKVDTDTTEQAEKGDDIDISGNSYLINLIDSPGHVDFSSEVTAALRVTDGALVVVDAIEGVAVQTGTVLRQAMAERVKPSLMVNKVDRALLELQLTGEEIYQNMRMAIENVNVIIESYRFGDKDWQVDPTKGTVAFGSGLHQWGFTLKNFAKFYAEKFKTTEDKMAEKLWGDWCFVTDAGGKSKWVSSTSVNSNNGVDKDTGAKRAFIAFIMDPIMNMFQAVMNNELNKKGVPKAFNMATQVGVTLTEEERKTLTGKPLLKRIMQKWIPAAEAVLEMVVVHLPSPATAAKYRAETLYDGPVDDEACTAIRNCDTSETAPTMMYVSKMIPGADNRFTAFGRVFSGKVSTGQKVRILGPNYEPGKKTDLFQKAIQRVVIMMGRYTETVADIPAGNTCGLIGVDQFIVKSGTITNLESACCIKTMKFAVSPVVRVAVAVKNSGDLPKLVEGLKKLSKSDPMVKCETTEAGEHIIAGCGELHLEICLKDLQEDFMKGAVLNVTPPVVTYMETVTKESSEVLSKSANKHNRLFCTVEPLNEEICHMFDEGDVKPGMDAKERAKILREPPFQWDEASTPQKIWCFGDDGIGPNCVSERTVGVAYLNEIKDSVVGGFKWACNEGPTCEEAVRGMKLWVNDVVLHADAIHRGMGQISPVSRRVTYAGMFQAAPALLEPMFLVNITCPSNITGSIYNVLSMRRGTVFDEGAGLAGGVANMKAYLPVAESFGFSKSLAEATSGAAFSQLQFDHWQAVEGGDMDFRDETTKLGKTIRAIRERKGLVPDVPPLDRYLDRL